MEFLDNFYDNILNDMNKDDFTVGDKYKVKYEDLGKQNTVSLFLLSISFSLHLFPK